ncbi:MAG: hypothetical protein IPM20_00655 [Gammaproteobacteria bacterium]|nr:hypothetical protein [Gammaproteobacteria bacterium]
MHQDRCYGFRDLVQARLRLAVLVPAMLMTVGCVATAPVKSDRFDAYRDAAEALFSGSKAALSFESEWTYRNYLTSITEGAETANPADIILEFPDEADDTFDWSLPNAPVFMAVNDTALRLGRINALFSEYVSLLAELAGGEKRDMDRILALGQALNRNSSSAAQALGLAAGPKETAFFSAAALSAANAYLSHKRRASLRDVLQDNQPVVEAFSRLGSEAAALSAVGIKTEYQNDVERWIARIVKATPSQRDDLIKKQLALNERTIAQLEALRQIHDGYQALSRKHAELALSLESDKDVDLHQLVEDGKRLRDLYKGLLPAEDSANDTNG